MTRDVHVFLDESAMAAAGRGNVLASRLIHRAHAEPGWFLYATVCALVEADRARRGALKSALRRLKAVDAVILGAALTKFDAAKSGAAYYGADYYRYAPDESAAAA